MGSVVELYVLPAFRGQGIASQLCHKLERVFKDYGVKQMFVEVWDFNQSAQDIISVLVSFSIVTGCVNRWFRSVRFLKETILLAHVRAFWLMLGFTFCMGLSFRRYPAKKEAAYRGALCPIRGDHKLVITQEVLTGKLSNPALRLKRVKQPK